MKAIRAVTLSLAVFGPASLRGQSCADSHYRWTVKTTLDLENANPSPTTTSKMLKWKPLNLYNPGPGKHDCTARADSEVNVYTVTGWARSWHIENGPNGDLDWHIELTQSRTTDSTKCIVVEIPDPQYGAVFDTARQDFLKALGSSKPKGKGKGTPKWLAPPVKITVVGAAFYDGQHRGAKGSGHPPHSHGHCNSSDNALWEIHPVYSVKHPT